MGTTPQNKTGHDHDNDTHSSSSSSSSSSGTEDNDTCVICENVGELLICDGCERSYHRQCLDPPLALGNVPDGDWFCPPCSNDEGNSNNTATAAAAGAATSKKRKKKQEQEQEIQQNKK